MENIKFKLLLKILYQDMRYMFNKCSKLTSLNLSNFNTNNVQNMSYMFNKCSI